MIDAAGYRKVIGTFATGVTVIATEVDGRLQGVTANAVTSVSLDPLLLLVCVDKRAYADGEMARARGFGVSILAEDQRELSNLFASSAERALDGGDHTIYLGRVVEGAIVGDTRPLLYHQGAYRTIA
jgi:flavin reductase (DIM6/NTAB) family NADH-FMN oxidoreductase RutF